MTDFDRENRRIWREHNDLEFELRYSLSLVTAVNNCIEGTISYEELVSIQQNAWNSGLAREKQKGLILYDRAIACCINAPESDEWKDILRQSVQRIHSTSNKKKRVKKAKNELEEYAREPPRSRESPAQFGRFTVIEQCARYVEENMSKFVNKRNPEW